MPSTRTIVYKEHKEDAGALWNKNGETDLEKQ